MKCTQQTEMEMRECESPWPKTMGDLQSYIASLVDRQHDYGTCAAAMSLAAIAAFNFVASKLGCTGFQSGCADMDFMRRSRLIKGPFMLVKMEDALFPQSDPVAKVAEAVRDSSEWLEKAAREKLAESKSAHPDIIRHWVRLAKLNGGGREYLDLADFREGERGWTDDFVEKHVADFKRFGIKDVHLWCGVGNAAKAESAEDGCLIRCGMPVSIQFEREIDGISVWWTVDTELEASNGTGTLRFDFGLLEALESQAQGKAKIFMQKYLNRARAATTKP